MKATNEVQAGLFIMVGIVLFIVVIWLVGQRRQIFVRQEEYLTTFHDVQGLSEGAPVRLGGISIGRVDKIGFSKDIHDPLVYVQLLVSSIYLERIRTDSLATIETQGLLGDKFVNINSDGKGNLLEPGSTLPSSNPADISSVLSKAGEVVDNTVKISRSLNDFIGKLQKDTLSNVTSAAGNLSQILDKIKNGNGFLHSIVYNNKDGGDLLDNLEKASANLKGISKEITTGDGLLNALIYDKKGKQTVEALTEASVNLSETSKHISELASEIENGNGLFHSLIYEKSPEGLNDIVAKLNTMASNLEAVSKSLANGNGTLGALLIDDSLYDNVIEITDGAKRSYLLKQAVRSTLK